LLRRWPDSPYHFDIQLSIFIVKNKYLLEFFASDTKAKIHERFNQGIIAIKSRSIALGFERSSDLSFRSLRALYLKSAYTRASTSAKYSGTSSTTPNLKHKGPQFWGYNIHNIEPTGWIGLFREKSYQSTNTTLPRSPNPQRRGFQHIYQWF
jgi:hypothetical protein